MTFEELRDRVVINLGGRNDTDTLSTIIAKTNFLIEWLAAQQEWEELQQVISTAFVASQSAYTLSELGLSDADKVYSVKMNDGSRWQPPMMSVTRVIWNRDYASFIDSVEGRPTVWCKFGGKLYFARTPDDDYSVEIDVYQQPTKVTGTASVIPFSNLDGLFEAVVTALTWLSVGEKELFSAWWKLAAPMINTFNLDSNRLMNTHTPNRGAGTTADPWVDPFRRR